MMLALAGPHWKRRLVGITVLALASSAWLVAAGPDAPAQVASTASQLWVARHDGPAADGSRDDYGQSTAADAAGNVYVAGATYADDQCCLGYRSDYQVVKYDSAGRQVWSRVYNGPGDGYDTPTAIAVDAVGNAYVTGYSVGTRVAGTAGDNFDFATVKYSPSGAQLWVARYDSADHGYDQANAVAVDAAGNVYVIGAGSGDGSYDTELTLVKLGSDGSRQWLRTYGTDTGDQAPDPDGSGEDVAVDAAGNVYVTGTGLGDYVTAKYSAAGAQQWLARFANPGQVPYVDKATSLELDGAGNVLVSGTAWGGANPGTYYDALTIKYGPGGNQLWAKRYDAGWNGNEEVAGLAVDAAGNVYVGGTAYGGSTTYYDYAVIAYDAAGAQRWVRNYRGLSNTASYEELTDLALDPAGNVVVTGYSNATAGNYAYDYATVSWTPAGGQRWAARYDGPAGGWDAAEGLAVDGGGNVVVTGESAGGDSSWDFATVRYGPGGTPVTTTPPTTTPPTTTPSTTAPPVSSTTGPGVTTTTGPAVTTTTRRRRWH